MSDEKLTYVGKLRFVAGGGHVQFYCPGCNDYHSVGVANEGGPTWSYNQDPHSPTFSPSILCKGKKIVTERGEWTGEWERDADGNLIDFVCHSFVRADKIQFLADCTHHLKRQAVDLPDIADVVEASE